MFVGAESAQLNETLEKSKPDMGQRKRHSAARDGLPVEL